MDVLYKLFDYNQKRISGLCENDVVTVLDKLFDYNQKKISGQVKMKR